MRLLAALAISALSLCAQSRPAIASFEFRNPGSFSMGQSGHGYTTTAPKDGGPTEIRYYFYAQGTLTAFRVTLQAAAEPGMMIATFAPWSPSASELPATPDGSTFTQVPLETYPSGVLLRAEERVTLAWLNALGERRLLEGTLYLDPPMSADEYQKLRVQRAGLPPSQR